MPDKATLDLEGMSCAGCANAIESALNKAEGVTKATVNLAAEKAYVEYDPGVITRDGLVEVVRSAGYDVKQPKERAVLKIGGMSCASCAAAVEAALKNAVGVLSVNVNIAAEKATVEFDPAKVDRETLDRIVHEAGYEIVGVGGDEEGASGKEDDDVRKMRDARKRMLGTWAFTIPSCSDDTEMFFGIMWPNHLIMNTGMILLAVPPLMIFGRKTFASAYRAVTHGSANMDVLIAMGTGAAFLTGPAMFFLPVANYAGVSAMIMAFHLTGRYIEATARGRASQAIKKLLELGVKTARDPRDEEVEVSIEELSRRCLGHPPGRRPTDGEVVEGSTSRRVHGHRRTDAGKETAWRPGHRVTINQSGFIKVRHQSGERHLPCPSDQLVEEAQGTKSPYRSSQTR